MTKGERELKEAGFTVTATYPGGKWFQVTAPLGEKGAVLRQSGAAWHFFAAESTSTYSGSSADQCHLGGLGDALVTESQCRTYYHLVLHNVPRDLKEWNSVYAAQSAAYHETH